MSLVLGSASPRRVALLGALGVEFAVQASDIPEVAAPGEPADAFASRLAREKGLAVARLRPGQWVLAADTVVVVDGDILGKPADAADARAMLQRLSARRHEVLTAAALIAADGALADEVVVRSAVTFRELAEAEIAAYVAGGEPADKAGAYAIQGGAAAFVAQVDGSMTNIIGLPMDEVAAMLRRHGLWTPARAVSREAMSDIAASIAAVRARIAAAAQRVGRDPAAVRLIAVSKTKSAAQVSAAIAAGVKDVGENYVQEAIAKRPAVDGAASWHLIGHLQRNKVAKALETFDCVHTVDSAALGETLARQVAQRAAPLPIFVEVNIGGEASKHGVAPRDLPALLGALRDPHLSVRGLMTVPPPGDALTTRAFFRHLRQLAETAGLAELSMGMTDDFEVAVEEGSTMVRVGRAIFGVR